MATASRPFFHRVAPNACETIMNCDRSFRRLAARNVVVSTIFFGRFGLHTTTRPVFGMRCAL